MDDISTRLLAWFDREGRHDLPWRAEVTAYRVWISEVMLQQTQVATVIPYYARFMARFPTVRDLATADLDDVLHHWTGLGYYARARNLHRTARIVVNDHDARLPESVDSLAALPGIGRSTAGAIASIAFGVRAPILDGNVKRVLARFHAVEGFPGTGAVARTLWRHADAHTPADRVGDYTQAIMDLGATVCTRTRPACERCPLAAGCIAHARGATEQFPYRAPRRDKPVRRVRMFLFHDASGACLLEQRPPSGVWGGLWTPPERGPDTDTNVAATAFGFGIEQLEVARHAPGFRHTFTHFHLDIEPVYVRVSGRPQSVRDRSDLRWHAAGSNEPLGLSAPAVKLLASLEDLALA